jgi:response regulator of citrate/malate metabolism
MMHHQKKVILIIEDDQNAQSIYDTQIRPMVDQLLIAKDAQSALKIINSYEQSIRLILLNIGLPDMNGFKLGEKLKKCGINVPIIAISSNRFSIEMKTRYKSIFTKFLVKPILDKDIKVLIERYLH